MGQPQVMQSLEYPALAIPHPTTSQTLIGIRQLHGTVSQRRQETSKMLINMFYHTPLNIRPSRAHFSPLQSLYEDPYVACDCGVHSR